MRFCVTFDYTMTTTRTVEAEDEFDARDKAHEMLCDESVRENLLLDMMTDDYSGSDIEVVCAERA